jgi:hypothetical protein
LSEFLPSFKPLPLTIASLMNEIRTVFSKLPDSRKTSTSNNLKYDVADAVLSAFSVFFTQSPSFLDYQVRMQKEYGKNNAQSIFGVHKLPSDNQIRNLLDPIPAETLFPVFAEVGDVLYQEGYLKAFRAISGTLLAQISLLRKIFPAPVAHNKPSKTAKP